MPKTLDDLCDQQALRNLAFHNRPKSFDQKCYDLAEYFLRGSTKDTEEYRETLAAEFQDVVENFGIEDDGA